MSTFLVARAIVDRLLADTGVGGLFETGNPLLTAATAFRGSINALAFPYAVVEVRCTQDDALASDDLVATFSVSVYDSADRGDTRLWRAMRRIRGDSIVQTPTRPTFGLHRHLLVLPTDTAINPLGFIGTDIILTAEAFGEVTENANVASIEGTTRISRGA